MMGESHKFIEWLFRSIRWILSGGKDAWLQSWAQILAGLVSGFAAAFGSFGVLTWQLKKDRERRLLEGGVELVQRRILQVRDQIKEYVQGAEMGKPAPNEIELVREALAQTALLYAYLQQRIGAERLRAVEQELDIPGTDGTGSGTDRDPALRRYLHSAFFGFYDLASRDDDPSRTRTKGQLLEIDGELKALYKFLDFTGQTLQRGLGRYAWRRKSKLLAQYKGAIGTIQKPEGGKKA